MNRTSSFALVAAAGLLMGGWSLSAKAADLGGDCCSDLEERVAELEATSVRKGTRKVSLELSGQVNKALMAWNDGKDSNVYVTDNNLSSTRFRLKGTGQMAPGWKAGFYMEYEFRDSSTNLVDQTNQQPNTISTALRIRQENVFVESEKFGRVTLGQQSSATKDIELINLGGALIDPEAYFISSFKVRDTGKTGTTNVASGGTISNSSRLGWGVLADSFDLGRNQAIRYDTPSIYGFIASAAWGEKDFYDVALRFQKEWNSIRVAAGIGYGHFGDPAKIAVNLDSTQIATANENNIPSGYTSSFELLKGSASVMHVPTGLYLTFSAGERFLNNPAFTAVANKDATFWEIQPGITKRFFEPGATTVFFDYANYADQGVGATYNTFSAGKAGGLDAVTGIFTPSTANTASSVISSSNVTRWGFGFTQAFDGAALELYSNYLHYSADVTLAGSTGKSVNGGPVAVAPGGKANIQDYDVVITGARIKF